MSSCLNFMADELNEGEFLNELSRRLAHSTKRIRAIYDGQLATENNDPWRLNYKGTDRDIVTSPQSTLCNATGGDISNHASPRYEEAVNKNMEATELLYAAAEEATSLQRRITGTGVFNICAPPPKPMPNQQFMQQQSTKKKQKGYVASGLLPSAWPKQRNSQFHELSVPDGSEMRAVFLGNQVTNGERSGTGVFLPRQAGSWNKHSSEIARKKPGYSTVLLPQRVVQALNLDLGAMETPHQRNKNGFFHQKYGNCPPAHVSTHAELRRDMGWSTMTNKELQLPQEWTY